MPAAAELLAELRRLPFFAELSEAAAACLARGAEVRVPADEIVVREGETPEAFYVLLEGRAQVIRQYGRQEVVMANPKVGTFFGEVPLLLDTTYSATFHARSELRVFRLPKAAFWELLRLSPATAREIFQTMATRVRNVENFGQQRERLESLGTMAAGLAHELYQPAHAALAAVNRLRDSVERVEHCLCELNGYALSEAAWERLDALLLAAASTTATAEEDALVRDEVGVAAWVREQLGDKAETPTVAESIARARVMPGALDALAAELPPAALPDALCWLAARLDTAAQLETSDRSTQRITGLVKAVKAYTFLDRAPMQEIDLHEGLESTLAMLAHRLHGVAVTRAYDRALPRLCAYGSELNQVWTHLLENALDATRHGSGESERAVCIRTRREGETHAVVEIADNGPGFGEDVRRRLFEPFFTTKTDGASTGMSLFMANRIVSDRHGGEIAVTSRPGDTRFAVRLPLSRD